MDAPTEWLIAWELVKLPAMIAIVYLAKRITDRVYRSPLRHTKGGFAAMYLSWVVAGAVSLMLFVYV
ncbi:MAG: hypothetical protein ACRCS9_01750 [Hyphomicrobium sp.]